MEDEQHAVEDLDDRGQRTQQLSNLNGGRPKASAEQIAQRDALLESVRRDIAIEVPPATMQPLDPDHPLLVCWRLGDDCPCRRLASPLEQGESLSDHEHVCSKTLGLGGADWARAYQSGGVGDVPLVIPFGDRLLHAFPGGRGWEDWPFLYVGGPRDLHTGVPTSAGGVQKVLRQWVEESDRNLTREILDRAAIGAERQRTAAAAGKREVEGPRLPLTAAGVETFRAETLPAWGVPATPSTARFLLWKLYGQSDRPTPPEAPTRGVLVTSLLIVALSWRAVAQPEERNTHLYQISGDSLWDSLTVRKEAAHTVEEHRDWLQKMPFSLNEYMPQRHNAGRPKADDALGRDLDSLMSGGLTEGEVEQRHMARLNTQKYVSCGRAANPQEKEAARKALMKRIRRRNSPQTNRGRI